MGYQTVFLLIEKHPNWLYTFQVLSPTERKNRLIYYISHFWLYGSGVYLVKRLLSFALIYLDLTIFSIINAIHFT